MESPSWSSRFKLVVGVIVFVLFCLLLYAARAVLPPIIIGVIIGYIFYPYARFIKYSTALPHRPATAILYLLLLAIIIPIVLALLPVISEQVVLVRDEILALLEQVNSISPEQTFELFGVQFVTEQVVQQVINTLIEVVRDLAGNAVNLVLNAAQVVLLIVITLIIGFYMTRDGDRFIAAVEDLIPDDTRGDIELLLAQIDNVWATFFRSNLLLAILVGTIVTALSAAIGLPRPLLM
ncbi:MAG: AI-2E family transporter, partial [Anaerolineae bacterium]